MNSEKCWNECTRGWVDSTQVSHVEGDELAVALSQ